MCLFSPTPSALFLHPLPLSGDGDEEHALFSHGVCQEWGDLWWVIFSSIRSVCPLLFAFFPYQLKKNVLYCVSKVFDKQGSIKVLLSLSCYYGYPSLNLKGHMIDANLTQVSCDPCHVLLVIVAVNVLTFLSCCIKWRHPRPVKAARGQPQRGISSIYYYLYCRIAHTGLVYCTNVEIMHVKEIRFLSLSWQATCHSSSFIKMVLRLIFNAPFVHLPWDV